MTPSEAYIVLNLLPDIGPGCVRRLLEVYPAIEEVLGRPADELGRVRGLGPKRADYLANWQRHVDLDEELRCCDQAGVRLVPRNDPDYPELLAEIPDPPLALYVRGNAAVLGQAGTRGLAVVGSRRHTHYGVDATKRLVRSAVQAGWIVVSGLARGIDTVAHETTLEADGITVAVIAGGLAEINPPENLPLARALAERGALVSEQPMRMRPAKQFFPMRNRIIAGLCRGTLVVEAGMGSGALITAQQAAEQGRLVYAVPGRIGDPQSQGCHSLIKQGAKLVDRFDDIMEDATFLPGFAILGATGDPVPVTPAPGPELTADERRLVDSLAHGELGLDQLVGQCQLPLPRILATLSLLEIKRVVRQLPGRRYALYTT